MELPTICSDEGNRGLQRQPGRFICEQASGTTRFQQHGGLRLANNRHSLMHADGTPFLWIGDTAWNGPLRSTPRNGHSICASASARN